MNAIEQLKNKWYGCLLANGFIKVNRYIGEDDYQRNEAQSFCVEITRVFTAETRAKAEELARQMLRQYR
jgi:hypothetical protein